MNINDISLTGTTTEKKKSNGGLYLGLGIVAIVIAIIVSVLSPSGPEDLLKKWVQANSNWDVDQYMTLVHPDVLENWDEIYEENYDMSYKEVLKKTFDAAAAIAEVENFEIDYEDYKVYEDDEFDDFVEAYFGDLDIDKYDIEEIRGYDVTFEYIYEEDSSLNSEQEVVVVVIKIDGKWYLGSDKM